MPPCLLCWLQLIGISDERTLLSVYCTKLLSRKAVIEVEKAQRELDAENEVKEKTKWERRGFEANRTEIGVDVDDIVEKLFADVTPVKAIHSLIWQLVGQQKRGSQYAGGKVN